MSAERCVRPFRDLAGGGRREVKAVVGSLSITDLLLL